MPGKVCTVEITDKHKFYRAMKQKTGAFQYLLVGYFLASLLLFLYSYTQVDLSLTLSRVSLWQTLQKFFQNIGYFQRPLSTALYVGLLVVFYALYFSVLHLINLGVLSAKYLRRIILVVTATLVLSYPAFSYDMFNYIFTAKTVLVYHKNPYAVIPLDFQGVEPMLNFMRWTHLPSAYTPFWIALTLSAYLLGFGKFLLILWNIKILVAGFYLATVWLIGKILAVIEPKHASLGIAIFALNPLVMIEALVSAHNDVVMMALAMGAFYLFLARHKFGSFFVLALSIATKLMTIFILPAAWRGWRRSWVLGAMLVGFGLVLTQREVLSWYWLWIMPLVALLPGQRHITVLAAAVSLGLLLRYAPYLYLGHWDDPVPLLKQWVTLTPIVLSLVVVFWHRLAGLAKPTPRR